MNLFIHKAIYILILNTLLSIPLFSQSNTGVIKGTVTDPEFVNISGASIILLNTNMGAVSDTNGLYIIKNVLLSKYGIRCSFPGYEVQIDTVEITNENPEAITDFIMTTSKDPIPNVEPFFNDTTLYLYYPVTLWYGKVKLERETLESNKEGDVKGILDTVLFYLTTYYLNKEHKYNKNYQKVEIKSLEIKSVQIGKRKYNLAIVNIEDSDKVCMTRYFQGSTGAYTTFLMIVANILQPQLSKPIIDGVIILYNNEELEELSHINLSGIISFGEIRYKVYRAYTAGF